MVEIINLLMNSMESLSWLKSQPGTNTQAIKDNLKYQGYFQTAQDL